MINYQYNISSSKLSIYDLISPLNRDLYIPTTELQYILRNHLVGLSLKGYPLRTRSKVVKKEICNALGYPVPKSFKKTQPKFPGQNFDVYTQKSFNVQIWNEEVDSNRRYVFLQVDAEDIVISVKIILGDELVTYDRTGTLTQKYQATMNYYPNNICSSSDTYIVNNWIGEDNISLSSINPNSYPHKTHLLRISEIYNRLTPMIGKSINYINALQERNRGAELHAMICEHLGYSIYEDDGNYPDIANQLLEVKLQTSPTIDLGLHSPDDNQPIVVLENTIFYSRDIRYAIFNGEVIDDKIKLTNLYLVNGKEFTSYFPLFKGNGTNSKIQMPLPYNFFD